MDISNAQVTDLLRCYQRDDDFIRQAEDNILSIINYLRPRNYYNSQTIVRYLTKAWYYLMTSASNLQTLGEEYTGIIRINNQKLPSRLVQIIWILLYVDGERILERLILSWKNDIQKNSDLTLEAKKLFVFLLDFINDNKTNFKRLHQAYFYIYGNYYNISNRLTGIKYGLLRKWMEDESFNKSFKLLGYLSLFYILFNIIQQTWTKHNINKSDDNDDGSGGGDQELQMDSLVLEHKNCILCSGTRKNPTATPCGHIFCWDCIYDCLKYQQNCPICREIVPPDRIIFLKNYW